MFLKSLCSTVERKFDNRFPSYYRTVSSDLYSLRAVPSHITVELFADCLNESGILHDYCSVEKRDSIFCAIGTWEEVEEIIEGAGGNAQFETTFLHRMLHEFDRGARNSKPYCRCTHSSAGKKRMAL